MRKFANDVATRIFWTTVVIYGLIWLTVSYVGVYVTYFAAPILLFSGIIAWFTSPNDGAQ